MGAALAPSDKRHLCRHHRQKLDVGLGRHGRHEDNRAGDVCHIHRRLLDDRAVGLRHAALHPLGHLGQGVADVDLAAGDVIFAAVERGRFSQPGDRVLARGVGDRVRPRHMRRDRAVVDDAAAHRLLVLHDLEGFLGAQERAGQDRADHRLPALERQFLDRRRSAKPGIVEQDVEPAIGLLGPGEECVYRIGIADIGRHAECFALGALDLADNRLQRLRPAAGDDDRKPLLGQRQCRGLADAAAAAGNERHLAVRIHLAVLLLRPRGFPGPNGELIAGALLFHLFYHVETKLSPFLHGDRPRFHDAVFKTQLHIS